MKEGNPAPADRSSLVEERTRTETIESHPSLNATQQRAADQIFESQVFESQEKIVGLDSVAGVGKTTTLSVLRKGVEPNRFKVEAN